MPRPVQPHVLVLDPVLELLAQTACSAACNPPARRCTTPGCDQAIAETLGVTRKQVGRWKREGLSLWQADTIATRLHAHPASLWGARVWDRAQRAHDAFMALRAGAVA